MMTLAPALAGCRLVEVSRRCRSSWPSQAAGHADKQEVLEAVMRERWALELPPAADEMPADSWRGPWTRRFRAFISGEATVMTRLPPFHPLTRFY